MAFTTKPTLPGTTVQIVFPQDPPKLSEAAIAAYPELRAFNAEMEAWWFSVRSNLRRLQETSTSGTGVSTTGVIPGTYGLN